MKRIIYLLASIALITINVSCLSSSNEDDKPKQEVQTTKQTKADEDLEYARATKDLVGEVVSRDTYESDKKIIIEKIKELNVIMKNKDYKSWLSYIDQASIDYWSKKSNLTIISKQLQENGRLPKTVNLKSLEDYFTYVFIRSRMGIPIDKIRYESSTSIKAVQVKDDKIVIYYNFKKTNDEWLVDIPVL